MNYETLGIISKLRSFGVAIFHSCAAIFNLFSPNMSIQFFLISNHLYLLHVHHKYRKLVSKYRLNSRFGSCSRR